MKWNKSKFVLMIGMLLYSWQMEVQAREYSVGFYNGNNSCPGAEAIVNEVVTKAVKADPSIAAALLRMVYHDCFVRVRRSMSSNCSKQEFKNNMILQPIYNTTEIAHKDLRLKVTNQPESI